LEHKEAVSSAFLISMSVAQTMALFWENIFAVALPIPDPEPVIITILSLNICYTLKKLYE
jgi:hypothetical protein